MLNHKKIKEDFPIFDKKINGKPYIYLDSACMSLKPLQVINAINKYYLEHPTCSGRSSYKLAQITTRKTDEARNVVANFINADKKEIVFTRNTTEGINLLANSLDFKNGDILLTTDKEHNSNLIPWQLLSKKKGIKHIVIESNNDVFDIEKYKKLINGVKLVSMVYTSNLDGTSIPAKEIIKIAHENGALVFLDVAQTIFHKRIDVKNLDVDFLAFSGHKILGPTGTGVFYGKYNLLQKLEPFIVGGSTVEYSTYTDYKMLDAPEKFEAGLQDYAGIIGLGEAIKYIKLIDFKEIEKHEFLINSYITEELNKIPRIKIIGPNNPILRSSIVSFYIDGVDSHKIALMLDEISNVMVRSGQHCVHSWFNKNNIRNSVRISLCFYNTLDEAKEFISTLKLILNVL